ncbi:MAG: transcription elongation GreA/GreB family factor [Bacteroidia bacterium]|jgi:transcription elongation GreA/GreB family factor
MKKSRVIEVLTAKLNDQLVELKSAMDSVSESIKGEEKSSAGDKYETSRAMNHIELDRLNKLYSNLMKNGSMLTALSNKEIDDKVRQGALVTTSKRVLFFCGGMGKVTIDGVDVLTMSMGAPIGQVFINKAKGETVNFNNTSEIIEDIQ